MPHVAQTRGVRIGSARRDEPIRHSRLFMGCLQNVLASTEGDSAPWWCPMNRMSPHYLIDRESRQRWSKRHSSWLARLLDGLESLLQC